jgi:hypothetical protein
MRQLPNWLWAALVLGLIGVVVWGWAFDFSRGNHTSTPPPARRYPAVVHYPQIAPSDVRPGILRESAAFVSATSLSIVTLGSSSCPSVPDELVIENRHSIRVHLIVGSRTGDGIVAQPPPSGVCTTDYGTTAMELSVDPTEIDVHARLTVSFVYATGRRRVVRAAALPGG